MKLVQIVVLYNKKLEQEKEDVFYFDNSDVRDIQMYNKKYSSVISMHGNAGLSKVYNLAINMFNEEYDYLQILDDDSILTDNFIEKFLQIAENEEYNYYLPKIISKRDNKVRYPVYKSDNVMKRIFNLIKKNTVDIKTINSGLIINLNKELEYFDEKLFLYCIDYEFSRRVIAKSQYKILELELLQDFSIEDPDIDKLIIRFRMITKDGKQYYSRASYYINYSLVYLNLCLKYRTLKFIPEIIKL